ncbi:hypothetical protein LB534_07350 [Mesorhizobium sp. CA18]|uniref:hypothetical protein n=1 Tax=unclassified Mesorhizobium TaxID=325217 RepID=UPI001CC93005|nr:MULTISPECIES: hypothetical protein [unclassified Mesorhizobium]MBZ9734162.1 hypothetical protein [Mesorhizobium sp. CA9]MBZ9825097.1 hypothetical protein [Mesorhizobium sp. CA18]MBZ9832140.1 hypothetical protein [Mesorhizobium sp. CA2]MBZ9836710.1 hypothetical protein [Mesorhizobium sp. CA3]MBZ9878330.1 hypothetical protein [Mesorhizobium sp. Ca11]
MDFRVISVEPLERFAVLPVHPWSAPCVVPGFKRASCRAGPAQRFAIENSERIGAAPTGRKPNSTKSTLFVCASIALKARLTRPLFFSRVNRNLGSGPETAVNRFLGAPQKPSDYFTQTFLSFPGIIFSLLSATTKAIYKAIGLAQKKATENPGT